MARMGGSKQVYNFLYGYGENLYDWQNIVCSCLKYVLINIVITLTDMSIILNCTIKPRSVRYDQTY